MKSRQKKTTDTDLVRANWQRFELSKLRGHKRYIYAARQNEDYYLGGGLQWSPKDRKYLEDLNRPVVEVNEIFPAVNTAKGMQLKNRVDIAFKPRGNGADEEKAEVLSKVVMYVMDDIKFKWKETQVFDDGMIQQRGYFDFRVKFNDNLLGNIDCAVLDPMDVLPDPDAQSYNPESWQDVIIMRWMSLDDIEQMYGRKKADKVEARIGSESSSGSDEDYAARSRFGDSQMQNTVALWSTGIVDESGLRRVLVLDRQWRTLERENVIVIPSTGELHRLSMLTDEQAAELINEYGGCQTKRMVERIRWTVTTADVVLHDDWSPYETFTVIPFFPYFRRGRTRGMVDNLKSIQDNLNKNTSLFEYIVAGIANSGWKVEQGSLTNMTTGELADYGSSTGIVIEYEKGSAPPERIQPAQIPQGIDRMIDRDTLSIKTVSGISDAMQGLNGPEVSGVAIQSKQYQGQTQLGGPLDNLAFTRHLVAEKVMNLVQEFYTEGRMLMITDNSDPTEPNRYEPLEINQETVEGEILNDVTIGDFDAIVSEHPVSDTFNDNQFTQVMDMRKEGVNIPDAVVVALSSLSNKNQLAQEIKQASTPPPDPLAEATAAEKEANASLKEAQAEKTRAETVNTSVDAQYSAMQAAETIVNAPDTAPLADKLLRSAGYEDRDEAPIVPELQGEGAPVPGEQQSLPPNYDPTTPVPADQGLKGPEAEQPEPGKPDSAAAGANKGIKTP